MFTPNLILLVLSALCFFLAAVGVAKQFNLVALGLFFGVLTLLIGGR